MKDDTAGPCDFWAALLAQIEKEIQDCNAVCGERLWRVVTEPGRPRRLVVKANSDTQDFVEANFDADAKMILCRFGRHARFKQVIRIAASKVTVEDAAAKILSGLRFPQAG
ncbi:MAG: hypothetical protein M1436_09945 [Acidobacteria bacterium]|nr:hypothetical protein [Acidobacteriota bacterium]